MAAKSTFMQIRVDPKQKAAIRSMAKRTGMDMSEWILAKLLPARSHRWRQLLRSLVRATAPRFVLAEINDMLATLTVGEFADAVAMPPPINMAPYLANYVAAMVECGAHRCGVEPPRWVADIAPLEHPVFGTDLLSLRALLLVSAPPPFRNRNIFIDATIGDRV